MNDFTSQIAQIISLTRTACYLMVWAVLAAAATGTVQQIPQKSNMKRTTCCVWDGNWLGVGFYWLHVQCVFHITAYDTDMCLRV